MSAAWPLCTFAFLPPQTFDTGCRRFGEGGEESVLGAAAAIFFLGGE